MKNHDQRIQVAWTNNSKRIAAEIIALDRERIFDYIEELTSELATMAAGCDQKFLGYLLNLASAEAKASKSMTRTPTSTAWKCR